MPTNMSNDRWSDISDFLQFCFDHTILHGHDKVIFEKYYANYRTNFNPYMRHHFGEQTREITDVIRQQGKPRLLEIGTGCGTEALWFAVLGAKVTTIDLKRERLNVARARLDWLEQELGRKLDIEFVESSIFDFRPDTDFDLIWMEQTYHHIEPRNGVAPLLHNLLEKGGACHISEANAWNPLLQAQLFKVRGFHTKGEFVDDAGNTHEYGDERITTPFALRRSLLRAGFKSAKSRNFRLLPTSNPPAWWLGVEKGILKVLPALSTHYNVVGTK
jgi:2-polyprenyl-3-methyl-5-hydroxy-6-metoxy-1,4-benzoquinol methylase